jgi:Cu+-exporting ATPase
MKKIRLQIDGMTCSACSNGLEKYLLKQKGIHSANVNLVLSLATIEYENLTRKEIEKMISNAGFKSLGEYKKINDLENTNEEKKRIILFGLLILLLMYPMLSHSFKLPLLPWLNHQNPLLLATFQLIISLSFLWYGKDYLKNGFKNLIHKIPNMDTLVMCSVTCSFLYSLYGYLKIVEGGKEMIHSLYFESVCMVIYFIKLGKWIEKGSINFSKSAIQKLVQITPQTCTLKASPKEKIVAIDEVKKDDILICKAGEKIAVDGFVVKGKTYVDESFITGESKPVLKEKNDAVIAGSLNYEGYIEYKATKIGKESTISSVVTLMIEATSSKNRIQKLADKISGIFVPCLLVLAFLTFLIQIIWGISIQDALTHMVTILVVACPCALGLAVPLVVVISNGLCAERGLFLKNGEVLELGKNIDTIVFDKTGTLTYGKLKIFKTYNYSNYKEADILNIVANLEAQSSHPIRTAFSVTQPLKVKNFKTINGVGITGKINQKNYKIGNERLIDNFAYQSDQETLTQNACSLVYVIEENQVIALIGVRDTIRENASKTIQELTKKKIEIIMLTGDNQVTAQVIGKELGIKKVIAESLPSTKLAKIESLIKEKKQVMMVGDGINDAPALVKSTIGVSIHSGTDIAADASDVILMNNDIHNLLDLLKVSKTSYQIIKQNLFWAFLYNTCMIPIAMGLFEPWNLHMTPMFGSIAMTLSSLTVVLNSLKLRRKINANQITN